MAQQGAAARCCGSGADGGDNRQRRTARRDRRRDDRGANRQADDGTDQETFQGTGVLNRIAQPGGFRALMGNGLLHGP
jgi:hypothetical protein